VSGAIAHSCPVCQAPALPADRFCEQCGGRLAGEPCAACGAPAGETDQDGYCTRCGLREPTAAAHREIDVTIAAGISDRGRVRAENQDALYLDDAIAAVVCDGISSSERAAEAARRAAQTAGSHLTAAVREPGADLTIAMADAICAAQDAVAEMPAGTISDAPGCTIVAAAVRGRDVVVGWVGDSRAYWLGGREASQLTSDDSWAVEQVRAGVLTAGEAATDPRAHAVTRWLGSDAPDAPPHVLSVEAGAGGRLVLCTDGLWNYVPAAAALKPLIGSDSSALQAAGAMVDHALAAGGRDNVTVLVIDIPPSGRPA